MKRRILILACHLFWLAGLSSGAWSWGGGSDPPSFSEERIKAFCVDFNWGAGGPNGFTRPGGFAQADPKAHYSWYKNLGVNTIQTFCVSSNGYAWYKDSEVAPVQPGLQHDFLNEITKLAHADGVRVMGYFCVGANTYWGQTHPDQSYGIPSAIHIPLTSDYLDYLCASIEDALAKTDIDGFMLDWMFSAPMVGGVAQKVQWMQSERRMYEELFGEPFPGLEAIDEPTELAFHRRALQRCWRRIRKRAKSIKPDCIIWLSCFDLNSPQLEGTTVLREVDWLLNETPTPSKLDAAMERIGPGVKVIQCIVGGSAAYDADRVIKDPKYAKVGLYGFAPWPDEKTTLPPLDPEEATRINIARNIEKVRRAFRDDLE